MGYARTLGPCMYVRSLYTRTLGLSGVSQSLQALRNIFDSLDANGNGVLDHPECQELCKKIGLVYSEDKFAHMMRKLDPDGDSQVSFDTFWKWFKKKHEKMLKKKLSASAAARWSPSCSYTPTGQC